MNRTRRAFNYQPPSFDEANKLSQRRGGRFDGIVKQDGPKFFKPKGGDNFIRIMPPTWDNARHYALEVKIHRNVGVDKQSYLCLLENEGSPYKECPICAERNEMARSKNAIKEEVDALRANNSLFIYLIDRSDEKQGPQLWGISNRSDAEILSQSLEKRQQVYLPVAHPIDGYDVEFTREGEGILTRYRGFKVARTSSPLTDNEDRLDEWLTYIEENPIPDVLQFYTPERIKLTLYGKIDADSEEPPPVRLREEREIPPDRTRPEARENGHDEPPFDTTPQPPRRAPLEATRPTPREVPETDRRRATLQSDNTTPEELKGRLRERLGQRRDSERQ